MLAQRGASYWYQKALLGGLTGLVKERVEKKLSEFAESDTKPPSKAPADAVKIGDHYYKVFWVKCLWSEALAKCKKMGGDLACCETQEEQRKIFELTKHEKENGAVWLGGRRDSSGKFKWLTGKDIEDKQFLSLKVLPATFEKFRPLDFDFVYFSGHPGCYLITRDGTGDRLISPQRGSIRGFICEWGN